jgi:hypothetical protein
MGRHPVAVVTLHITYARSMKVDYSRFSWGRATWEACSGNLERKNGNHRRICSMTQENQEKPVSRYINTVYGYLNAFCWSKLQTLLLSVNGTVFAVIFRIS